jgi:hypothetical protein
MIYDYSMNGVWDISNAHDVNRICRMALSELLLPGLRSVMLYHFDV